MTESEEGQEQEPAHTEGQAQQQDPAGDPDQPPQFPGDVGEAPDQAGVSDEEHERQDKLTEEATPEDQDDDAGTEG